jgi:FtsP/CotA-like multicopper oxidase with cupredoxin domain
VISLAKDCKVVAGFELADVIRPERYTAVQELHDHGAHVAMLTGGSKDVANAVTDELGIETYRAELQRGGRMVGLVGDDADPRKDTVLLPPMSLVDLNLAADNPGSWLLHGHNAQHAESGMMTRPYST